jgi:hypothetical protein
VDITFYSLHLCSIRENSDSVGIGLREKKERNTTTRTKRPQIINKINKVNVPEGSIDIKLNPLMVELWDLYATLAEKKVTPKARKSSGKC